MRILMLHNFYAQRGGEDEVFLQEVSLLRNYGHEVITFTVDNKHIKSSLRKKILAGFKLIFNREILNKISELVKQRKPDIIHVHNFFPQLSPSIFFLKRKIKIPIILTLHNYRLICPGALLFRGDKICEFCIHSFFPIYSLKYKCYHDSFIETFPVATSFFIHKILKTWTTRIDKYIALTNFQKEKILSSSLGIPAEKIVVKPNFVKDFGPGFNKRENFFLFVGRLSKEKGIQILLEALKYLPSYIKIKIAGEGPLKDLVIEYAKSFKNLEYLGFKKKEEIIFYMKKAKALIFPSIVYEGFPMVLVEALSTGTPVITSNIGSQASIIEDGKTGLHFNVSDPKDLATKIKIMQNLKNKKLYENARKEYLSKYTPEINYKQLMEIYNKVIYAAKEKSY